ncbi:MAG: xanthine dehydrogenase family protein molybdopterin-binding subunit, partial [Chthoniobacterales bacterium]|nr:xanthine dehydrogenase family protein molybdopterin-binding subunit [Chthoniobacterales bacterium]
MTELATPPPITQPIQRVDGKLKVTGGAKFAAEFAPGNLVYAQLIQSTIANGRVIAIETATAKKAPGVLGVFTRSDIPPFHPYPDELTKKGAPGESRVPLQDDEVHFIGQHLGILVADSFERAQHAISLVRVQYARTSPALTLENSEAQKSSTRPEYFVGREKLQVGRGDVNAALASA